MVLNFSWPSFVHLTLQLSYKEGLTVLLINYTGIYYSWVTLKL